MADDTSKFKSKLSTLSTSLSQLESSLEPLLSRSLPETTLALDTIQQAKLQVAIPYLVYDLVFSQFEQLSFLYVHIYLCCSEEVKKIVR